MVIPAMLGKAYLRYKGRRIFRSLVGLGIDDKESPECGMYSSLKFGPR